jgi:hypothetical protein
MKLYTHKEVLRIFPNLKTRTLISWSEKGLMSPAIEADGTGSMRRYSFKNLIEIGVIRELIDYRFSHDVIRPIIECIDRLITPKINSCDFVLVFSKQCGVHYKDNTSFANVQVGSRSDFGKDAAKLVFRDDALIGGKFDRVPYIGSAIVVSVADIWMYIKEQL